MFFRYAFRQFEQVAIVSAQGREISHSGPLVTKTKAGASRLRWGIICHGVFLTYKLTSAYRNGQAEDIPYEKANLGGRMP